MMISSLSSHIIIMQLDIEICVFCVFNNNDLYTYARRDFLYVCYLE